MFSLQVGSLNYGWPLPACKGTKVGNVRHRTADAEPSVLVGIACICAALCRLNTRI